MSLLVVANTERPLTRICQLVGHFLAYRGRRQAPSREAEAVLGIWWDPSPLATVTALGQDPSATGTPQPLVRETSGQEGEWYVCRLAADPGPHGEIESLVGLLNLLTQEGLCRGRESTANLSPCFAETASEADIRVLAERLADRFPGMLNRAITHDAATGRLRPQPDLRSIPPG